MDEHPASGPEGLASPRRNLAVVGASAGGVEALIALARNLPAELPMACLVVLHRPVGSTSRLAHVLDRAGPLPAVTAEDGQAIQAANLYVAPPDRHMILSGDRLFLVDGPRENGVRPAIDPLFRSAASDAGPRAIGIILSGTLDDGAAGMAAIQAFGGATIVQDPADAMSDGMPRAVLDVIEPDFVVPAPAIGPILRDLAAGAARTARTEQTAAARALVADPMTLQPRVADLVCPDCGGSLAEVEAGTMTRYRCRVGHVYSPESLDGLKKVELEAGLWAALRSLEESASIAKKLAAQARSRGSAGMAGRFEGRQADAAQRADLIRQALHTLTDDDNVAGTAETVSREVRGQRGQDLASNARGTARTN
jgi:two-component system chemotaxis response regulator CheB